MIIICYDLKMLNEQWLNTFISVVEVGHFTKASEKLGMTQPGVSQHLQKLEATVGHELLNRIGKGFELTRQGKLLYEYALKKKELEADMLDQLSFESELSGTISVACSGALASLIYPLFLQRQASNPKLKIKIEAVPNHLIKSKVLNNEVDVGISTSLFNSLNLIEEEIGIEELCLVYPRNVRISKSNIFDSLMRLGFINHPDGKFYFGRFINEGMGNLNDFSKLEDISYVNQINQILVPISMGMGFTVMPKRFVEFSPLRSKVRILKQVNPIFDSYYLLRKRNKILGKRYDWFLNKVRLLVSDNL
ncbi:MAG: LysR family transcriptional regulator [Halobacteriovoraceae bacterium]|nr:LysR family transcriptional regulator [Halobacteriovoraceae bacterium]